MSTMRAKAAKSVKLANIVSPVLLTASLVVFVIACVESSEGEYETSTSLFRLGYVAASIATIFEMVRKRIRANAQELNVVPPGWRVLLRQWSNPISLILVALAAVCCGLGTVEAIQGTHSVVPEPFWIGLYLVFMAIFVGFLVIEIRSRSSRAAHPVKGEPGECNRRGDEFTPAAEVGAQTRERENAASARDDRN